MKKYIWLSLIETKYLDHMYAEGANESSNEITPEFIGRWFIP